jgi:hypothetical protein
MEAVDETSCRDASGCQQILSIRRVLERGDESSDLSLPDIMVAPPPVLVVTIPSDDISFKLINDILWRQLGHVPRTENGE